jgi:HAD superfamily hydrolase (TIGR01509 family)
MSNIKNIIFDLGGVILNIDYHRTTHAFVEKGVTSFAELYSQLAQLQLFDDYETGRVSTATFIYTLQQWAPHLTQEDIIMAWNAMLLDLPADKIEWIQTLRGQFKVFLFSNTNELHEIAFNQEVQRVLQTPSLDNYFDKVYLSHKIGFRKPNPEGFEQILIENGLVATETLFIDDSPQHIAGAARLGIQTLYLPFGKVLKDELLKVLNNE